MNGTKKDCDPVLESLVGLFYEFPNTIKRSKRVSILTIDCGKNE
jgi:hypothetical protein